MQEKYWKYMVQIKAWIHYLKLYEEDSYKYDKYINMTSAIASSSSIAAWAMWKEFSHIWSVIIAISQVITAVKIYLPYNSRLQAIVPFSEDLKLLYNKVEYNWFDVASGNMSEKEINELLYQFKNEYTNIENKNLKDDTLLDNEQLMKKADEYTDQYFENNF